MAGLDELGVPSAPSVTLSFISASTAEKADPATRKLIRSHVMRGRKRKNGVRNKDQGKVNLQITAARPKAMQVKLEEVLQGYTPLVPNRIGSDFSFIDFPDEIEPSIVFNITHISPAATRVIFPLMAAISFQTSNAGWHVLIGSDVAALHITVFAIECFINRFLRHQENSVTPTARLHFQKGLKLLRERLSGEDDEMKISDSTMAVVAKLASTAHIDGDYQAAKYHMEGLRRMVDLRGGLGTFKDTFLLVEILRCDLGIALLNGSDPAFYCQPKEPVIDYPKQLLLLPHDRKMYFEDDINFIQDMDNDLVTAWRVIRRFCLLVNLGMQTQRLIRPELIYETMSAVMYRLLHMRFAYGSTDEVVRYGLLAFSYHIFLQWQDVKLPYDHFSTTYQSCVRCLKHIDGFSSELMLWLLMTGALSVYNVADEAWLGELVREYADRCQVRSWKEMRDILKSLIWIDLLHEPSARRIYDLIWPDEGECSK